MDREASAEAAAGGRGAAPHAGDPAAPEQRGTESQEYLKKEQKELLAGGPRARRTRAKKQRKKRAQETARKPFTLKRARPCGNLQLTPDEKYVIASVFESAAAPAKNTIVPNFITDTGYTEDIPGRSNVGDSQGASRLAILNVETGEVKWVDHGQKQGRRPAGARPPDRALPSGAKMEPKPSSPPAPPTTKTAGSSPSTPPPARPAPSSTSMTTPGSAARKAPPTPSAG